jgi:hypothetical protein
MPPNTEKVTRPGLWGNPFSVAPKQRAGSKAGGFYIAVPTVEDAIACYRIWLNEGAGKEIAALARRDLRGKNLACWCDADAPCHADVLLEIANG